jgi:hypothetical protein
MRDTIEKEQNQAPKSSKQHTKHKHKTIEQTTTTMKSSSPAITAATKMAKSRAEYNKLTCKQLKALLKGRGLPQKGIKKELIDRLMENDAAAEASPVPAEASPVAIDSPGYDAEPASPVAGFNTLHVHEDMSFKMKLHQKLIRQNQDDIADLQDGHEDLVDRHEKYAGQCGHEFNKLNRSASKSARKIEELERSAAKVEELKRELEEVKRVLAAKKLFDD